MKCQQCPRVKPRDKFWYVIPTNPAGDEFLAACNVDHFLSTIASLEPDQWVDWAKIDKMYPELSDDVRRARA